MDLENRIGFSLKKIVSILALAVYSTAFCYVASGNDQDEQLIPKEEIMRKADMNSDGIINLRDYAELAKNYLSVGDFVKGDLNEDYRVDSLDTQIMASFWLTDTSDNYFNASDINDDGRVDFSDYGVFAANYGAIAYGNEADINSDGFVDTIDLGILLGYWLEDRRQECDINNDSNIDFLDFSLLSSNWGGQGADILGDINKDNEVGIRDLTIFSNYWLETVAYDGPPDNPW